MPKRERIIEQVSIWRRGLAFLIDIIIIQFIVNLSFNKILEPELGTDKTLVELFNYSLENYSSLEPKLLLISIVTAFCALIYFTILEFKLQQTLGKMLFNIKVVSERKTLEYSQVLLRNAPKILFFVNYTSLLFLVDILYYSVKKQRLFDKLARTSIEKVK